MNKDSIWLSETNITHATTVIIFGAVDTRILADCHSIYGEGVLLVTSEEINTDSRPNFFIAKPEFSSESFLATLTDFFLLNSIHPPELKVSVSIKKQDKSMYEDLIHLTLNEIDTLLRARKTRKETGFLRQLQIFENLDGYLGNRIPEDWKSLSKNNLAVVVGAGPSLDLTLPLIKNGLPSPVIIASDSSLKALAKENIFPHFVVSIDPEKSFEACGDPKFKPGIALLSSQSHSSWAKNWDKKCFISGRVISEDWLGEKGVGKSSFQAINNAGLTALAFADFISPSAILLVGMDLAGGGDGRVRYAESTGRSHIEINASTFHQIPGNYNKTVPTPFFSDWHETSQSTAIFSQRRSILNLNDRGAYLDGANLIHPRDFEEVKKILKESLIPFAGGDSGLLSIRREIKGLGLNQVLTLMTTRCDQLWQVMEKHSSSSNFKELFKEIFSDTDNAYLLGDFAFSIMPRLSLNNHDESFNAEREQLKILLWKLEDGILKSNPSEEFIKRFLTENFA